jgi:hypothetical protein
MIRWGKRRYLIPPEEIFDFCAEVRGGCEPRCKGEGNFLLHQGDEKIEPDADELQLPERFRKYLRMRQLEVGIKTLARNSEVSIPMRAQGVQLEYAVTVDAGSAEGVLPRMRFRKPPPSWGGELVVAETSLHESKGVLAIQSAGGPSFIEPKVGERFRTPGPTHCSSPRVFPLAGKVTVDGGPPPQGGGWQIVVMLDDQTESMPYRSFAECQPDGRFSFSKYKANDGTKVGSYVVLIASLQRDKLDQIYSEHLVGPDRFNNLYNDPAVNARRPGFVIEHQKPGRTDYVFDLKTRGAEPNKRPGPRALTETAR